MVEKVIDIQSILSHAEHIRVDHLAIHLAVTHIEVGKLAPVADFAVVGPDKLDAFDGSRIFVKCACCVELVLQLLQILVASFLCVIHDT